MSRAEELVEEIRQELKDVEARIAGHPYLKALEQGDIAREKLRLFAGEQYHIVGSDMRSFALLVSRYGDSPSGRFFLDMVQGERAALEALSIFASGVGLSPEDLEAYEPTAGAQAYPAYVAWLALHASDAEVAGAFVVNLAAWGANCAAASRALQGRYGLAREQVEFFELFAIPSPEFERAALDVVEGGLARGVEPRLIRRAGRLLQGYELLFWDTVFAASRD
jgi:pyrroloquinoline quinone (PQQ) biosynthesis protein C